MTDFLAELGTEEIPAGYLGPAAEFMSAFAARKLSELGIQHGAVRVLYTPRRLALSIEGLADRGPDRVDEARGPSYESAFDASGAPKGPAVGFARSKGLRPEDLEVRETPKGRYVFAVAHRPGEEMPGILRGVLASMVPSIPWPKSMRWGFGAPPFARPLRYVFAVFGSGLLDFGMPGVPQAKAVRGHPFMGGGGWVEIPSAGLQGYVDALRAAGVYADPAERKAALKSAVAGAVARLGGLFSDESLLDEVSNLLEYPGAGVGSFDRKYLGIPAAILEAAMIEHQRYFPVRTPRGALKPRFVAAVNRKDGARGILKGNERVLRARLEDASFFFREDRKRRLEDRIPGLAGVMYLKGGGSMLEKAERLARTAEKIGTMLSLGGAPILNVVRAARLCKADLLTEVVGEFPSLQGRIGRLYADFDGELPAVSAAIEEHYMPKAQGGALPESDEGRTLALADRMQTLADCFALGLRPSGSKDPFGLRRSALGAVRIALSFGRSLRLDEVLASAAAIAPGMKAGADAQRVAGECREFLRERIYQAWTDRGYPYDLVNAALSAGEFLDVWDFERRLETLVSMKDLEWWPELVELSERTYNITRDFADSAGPDPSLATEEAERMLFDAVAAGMPEIERLIDARSYAEAAEAFRSRLAGPVRVFFDKVFVNVDDAGVRANRLRLVKAAGSLFNSRVANLSLVVTGRRKETQGCQS